MSTHLMNYIQIYTWTFWRLFDQEDSVTGLIDRLGRSVSKRSPMYSDLADNNVLK